MRARLLRRRVVEEWRGLPDDSPDDSRCVTAAQALARLLPKLGLEERLNEEQVRKAWTEIVGPFLAGHSAPAALRAGVLTIQVLQPSVRYELERTWKPEILKKLRARFGAGKIRGVRFA